MPKLVCGPMATLSHEAFRRAVESFGGCDEYYTEMINAPSLLNMGPFEKYYLMNGPCPEKLVWQLTGNRAEPLAKAAAIVAERGGIGVDINMGCSAPQIYRTGAGIAWMGKPLEETAAAVRGVRQALAPYPAMRLSVKCRLGDGDFTEEGFFRFTDMLVNEGVRLITLHPRTKKEKSRGRPRWEYAEKLCLRYGGTIKIYLNGGVKDAADMEAALSAAPGCDGIMLARAAAQQPWIFAELRRELTADGRDCPGPDGGTAGKGASAPAGNGGSAAGSEAAGKPAPEAGGPANAAPIRVDCQKLALDFIADIETCQPPEFHRTRLQRFFSYYCDNFSFAHYFKSRMLNAATPDESRKQVIDYFEKEPDDRYRDV